MDTHDFSVAINWFKSRKWTAFPFQKEVWTNYLDGKSGMLNAPTGSGKTYALWIPTVLEYIHNTPNYKKPKKNRIQVLWVTPLRALAKDIQYAMQAFCREVEVPWEVGVRTGDTPTSQRQRQKENPPECLVITPESLHILMSNKNYPNYFKELKCIVVDEWHELLGTKRGVQVEIVISRLRGLLGSQLKVWGISATIGNMDQALDVLLGQQYAGQGEIIRADIQKRIEVESVLPEDVEKFPWAGHLGIHLVDKVLDIINASETTLLFTNTRSQTELWYQYLITKAPELAGILAMHHGSIDLAVRGWVEDALHEGKLKCVVCTSSLDLGVDFRPVDTVIQVGGPKGVSMFFQRAGRSGHHPGSLSKIYFVPTHSLELVEGAALRSAIDKNIYEMRRPLENTLDVLVQYLVTLAVGDGLIADTIKEELRNTYTFRNLTDEEWDWCIDFITTGGKTLGKYDEFSKVIFEKGVYKVINRRTAMRHRMSIGTIVGDPVLKVKFLSGGLIGTVEESFMSKLNPGDNFWFSGRNLEYVKFKDLTVYVRKAKSKKGIVPVWGGGRLPLSSRLSELIKAKLTEASEGIYEDREMIKIKPILDLQEKWSVIPDNQSLLIEKTQTKNGYHIFVYPFEGRFVHEVLAGLIAFRIGQLTPISFSIAMNDYGFELLSDQEIPIEEALEEDLFRMDNLMEEIHQSINMTEMAKKQFRDVATISGLIFQGYPGKNITAKHLHASTGIIYKVFEEYDNENLLIKQAMDEVITLQLDKNRMIEAMERINRQKIILKEPPKPTPFAFPIMVDGLRAKLTSEELADRIAKMTLQFESII